MRATRELPGAYRDLFELVDPNLPADIAGGLVRLQRPPARWPLDQHAQWPAVLAGVTAFARRWDRPARECGWTILQLYGLDERVPWQNLAAMGAAFLVACAGRSAPSVSSVNSEAVLIVTRTGSRLRIYRRPPDPSAAIAWDLCDAAIADKTGR